VKYELKSIGYWSLIKISFIVNLIVGFIVGFFFALFIGIVVSLAANLTGMTGVAFPGGELPSIWVLIIIYPFMFGFGGAVFNTILYVIIAFIYNIAAKGVGGVELELNEVRVQTSTQIPPPMDQSATRVIPTPPPQTPPPPPPKVEPLPPDMQRREEEEGGKDRENP
jgi:hypothetical protein